MYVQTFIYLPLFIYLSCYKYSYNNGGVYPPILDIMSRNLQSLNTPIKALQKTLEPNQITAINNNPVSGPLQIYIQSNSTNNNFLMTMFASLKNNVKLSTVQLLDLKNIITNWQPTINRYFIVQNLANMPLSLKNGYGPWQQFFIKCNL
jgi:hypothetical protein